MKVILAFLFRDQLRWGWAALTGALGVLFFVSLWVLGVFTNPTFNDSQNTAFNQDLRGPKPPAAIAAATRLDAGFGLRMRTLLAEEANNVRRSGALDSSGPGMVPLPERESEWMVTHVCGLEGWGAHREVVRTLVTKDFGDCGLADWLAAKSPVLDVMPNWFGWLFTLLWPALFVLALISIAMLFVTRRAYFWLYSSNVVS